MKPQRPTKPKPINFVRNDTPLPMVLPVEFSVSIAEDVSKMSKDEYWTRIGQAETNFIEAWLLQQAQKEPDGHYAQTYFTKTT